MNKKITLAKYVRKVTTITASAKSKWDINLADDGSKFSFQTGEYSKNLKVGDKAYIAKLIPTLVGKPFLWEIHEVLLPVNKFFFELYEKETGKNKRMREKDLLNHPQTWFVGNTFIIEKLK